MSRLSELKDLAQPPPSLTLQNPQLIYLKSLSLPPFTSCSPIPIHPVTRPSIHTTVTSLRLFRESCKGPYGPSSFPKNHTGKIRPVPLLPEVPILVHTGQGIQNANTRERMNKQVSMLPLWSALCCAMQSDTEPPLTLLPPESGPSLLV